LRTCWLKSASGGKKWRNSRLVKPDCYCERENEYFVEHIFFKKQEVPIALESPSFGGSETSREDTSDYSLRLKTETEN